MICARCGHDGTLARRLCSACYRHEWRTDNLEQWPTIDPAPRAPADPEPYICVCPPPATPETIPWFPNARQCARCSRPFIDDLTAELEGVTR
jgi:hypothetical protein